MKQVQVRTVTDQQEIALMMLDEAREAMTVTRREIKERQIALKAWGAEVLRLEGELARLATTQTRRNKRPTSSPRHRRNRAGA